jgi:hypothetical protein
VTVIGRIDELDALPSGTVIVGLDPQATTVHKAGGDWIDLRKPPGTTWNLRTYVMVRRWGFRVASQPERNIEVSDPIKNLKLEAYASHRVQEVKDQFAGLAERYAARLEARDKALSERFLDENGDFISELEDEYRQAEANAEFEIRVDLINLIGEIRKTADRATQE